MEISLGVTVGTLKLDLSQKMAAWARAAATVCWVAKQKITDLPRADPFKKYFYKNFVHDLSNAKLLISKTHFDEAVTTYM